MLPLHELIVDGDVTDLEVEAEGFTLTRKTTHRLRNLLKNALD